MAKLQKNRRQLRMQMLESRQMMAGDVRATLDGDTLQIRELASDAGQAQQVEIQSLSSGAIRVRGISNTLVNGRSYRDFRATNLDIALGDGDDYLTFSTVNGGLDRLFNVTIDVGSDRASNNDDDRMFLDGLRSGFVDISTGSGVDIVQAATSRFYGLDIDTGSGRDRIDLNNVTSWVSNLDLGSGNDQVNLDNSTFNGALHIDGGSDNDTVNILRTELLGFRFTAGAGIDSARIQESRVIGFAALIAGSGRNELSIESSTVSNNVTLNGSTGTSNLRLSYSNVGGDVWVNGGTGNENVSMFKSSADDLRGNFGRGNDGIVLDSSTVDDVFTNLGADDDYFLMINSRADWFAANGSSGTRDQFLLSGTNRLGVAAMVGFEEIGRL